MALPLLLCLACGAGPRAQSATSTPSKHALAPPPPTIANDELAQSGLRITLLTPGAAPRATRSHDGAPPTFAFRVHSSSPAADGAGADTRLAADRAHSIRLGPQKEGSYTCTVDAGASQGARWFTEELDCAVTVGPAHAVTEVRMLDRDQQTGDDDDAGDAMAHGWQAYGDIRWSAQWLSLPWPAEPVGVGASWQVDVMLGTDGVLVRRSMRVTLTSAEHVELDWTDLAPLQNVRRFMAPPWFHEICGGVEESSLSIGMLVGPDAAPMFPEIAAKAKHEGHGALDLVAGTTWLRAGTLTTTRTTSSRMVVGRREAYAEPNETTQRRFVIGAPALASRP